MESRIYGFGFINNISAYTLYCLKNVDCCYLLCGEKSIDKYLEFLLHGQPTYILGLGMYTGPNQKQIRIERKTNNRFGQRLLSGDRPTEVNINPFLEPLAPFSGYASSIGNYYCNMASWKIMELIKSGKLKSRYCFLHIPKTIKAQTTATEIDGMIEAKSSIPFTHEIV